MPLSMVRSQLALAKAIISICAHPLFTGKPTRASVSNDQGCVDVACLHSVEEV